MSRPTINKSRMGRLHESETHDTFCAEVGWRGETWTIQARIPVKDVRRFDAIAEQLRHLVETDDSSGVQP